MKTKMFLNHDAHATHRVCSLLNSYDFVSGYHEQLKFVEIEGCSEKGRWTIGDLKMQTGLKYEQPSTQKGRTDVNAVTNWNAPLVWEGTFDPVVIDAIYKRLDPRVAVVVLAVGKYTRFLKGFLESAEKYFLVDFRVTYYIFTDNKQDVPKIELGTGRKITVLDVPSATRWQDVVLSRMKWATIAIDKQIRNEADYLFMMDVDSIFRSRFGAESLSPLSAVLHRGYYKVLIFLLQYLSSVNGSLHLLSVLVCLLLFYLCVEQLLNYFPYERRGTSKAYIPPDEGDYYYTAAVWGGYLEEMYKLVKYCYKQSEEDAKNNIEAVWQEESHLNRYLLYNKPTKVLSPEYLWADYDQVPEDIRVVRISQLVKNYAEVRPNGGQ
ncbi:globoside alpha-1,3-N-acetylgalactosaminyltransferase 1-like [Seriola aureovittata]|uniref:globoside alpha-1,3-N-acetylgalactosaminyltransferase 1-like n=1 Tax=Seriola aureovittata TaxID=2871759 RepID=UPI0024BF0575|nr:globoside alpha-1,3-N-acetylgalactosaminyltransferase 1-like [Seriola aureovittata]